MHGHNVVFVFVRTNDCSQEDVCMDTMSGGLFSHLSVSGLSVCMPASDYRVSVYLYVRMSVYTLRYARRHLAAYAHTCASFCYPPVHVRLCLPISLVC